MRKLKLSVTNVKEVLSRAEMKSITGGFGSEKPECNCNTASDCSNATHKCLSDCLGGRGAGHCGAQ